MSLLSPVPAFCLCWLPGPGWLQPKGDGDHRLMLDVLWVTQSLSGCPVIPEDVTQALGRSPVLWDVLSVLGFSYNIYFFCFRCQGRERSISILVTGAPGVFQAVCHDVLHGCRRKCPVREGSFCIADYRGGSFPCWSSGAAPWWGWNLYQKSPWEEQLFCRADASLEHHLCALGQLGQDLWHSCGAAPPS